MKADKKTLFSIFIVLLFVGSLFGIITYGGGRNTPAPTDINGLQDINTEPVNYQAQFDANIIEIFPQIIVAGKPTDYDSTTVENKLLELQGVKNKTFTFRQTTDGSMNLIITISFVPEKKEEIISKIKELEIIEEPIELYQQALLSVPEDANFTSDSNQTIEYYFGEAPMEGVIGIDSLKGDSISVFCYASFSGNQLLSATGIESYNNSSSPQMLVSSGDFNVISYESQISLQAENMIIYSKDKNSLEEKIKKDYNNTEFSYNVTQNLIYNISEDQNTEELEKDMNTLKENSKILDYSIDTEANTLEVYLKEDVSLEDYNLLKTQIKDLTNSKIITSEPKITLNILFNYSEIDIQKINEIISGFGFENAEYKTAAIVDTNNLVIEGQKYQYEQATTIASVDYPEDLNKTTLTLQIQAYAQRDKILYLGLSK